MAPAQASPPYVPQSPDTTKEVEDLLFASERRLDAGERVRRQGRMNQALRRLALDALRERHPAASEEELALRLAARQFPREVMVRVWRWDPALNGGRGGPC